MEICPCLCFRYCRKSRPPHTLYGKQNKVGSSRHLVEDSSSLGLSCVCYNIVYSNPESVEQDVKLTI